MSSEIAVTLMIVAVSAVMVWILRTPVEKEPTGTVLTDEIDYEELNDAEEEVQELDAFTSPDDADEELRDWGPGAPH